VIVDLRTVEIWAGEMEVMYPQISPKFRASNKNKLVVCVDSGSLVSRLHRFISRTVT
jgi:hypothetical protein